MCLFGLYDPYFFDDQASLITVQDLLSSPQGYPDIVDPPFRRTKVTYHHSSSRTHTRELTQTLERWVKSDLRAPTALAVRFTILVSTLFIPRQQVAHCSTNSEKFITKIRRILTESRSTRRSPTSVRRRPQLTVYVPLSESVSSPCLLHV